MFSFDSQIWFIISFSLPLLMWFISKNKNMNNSSKSRPPGPPGWPIIGNIFDVGMMPHQNLQKLQSKYGPVLWLKLGMSNTLVIQSSKSAEEIFKRHDLAFSDRNIPNSFTAFGYNKGSMALAPYNDYWRMIRKLCSSELFLHKRINASAPARQNCIDVMIQRMKDDSLALRVNGESGEIELDKYLCLMTFNLIANFMLSRDIMDLKSEKGNEFYEAMKGFMEWSGKPNLVDSFPFLKWIDPQGIRGNTGKSLTKLLNMVSGFLRERVQEKLSGKVKETKDFLDVLLERNDDGKGTLDELSEKNVTIIVLEMFFGGTETTSGTIHWGLSELIRNPKSLKKLQNELDQVIGRSRKVEENDLNKLPYLQAVVKEIMRLHPSLPLLLPRKAVKDTEFMGYSIPKDTTVILNAWAIHRDPNLWDEPLMFKPERFIDSKIDSKGQNFEFLPFGSGRRSCVGMFLGDRMVSITLARLIQSFDWELPRNVSRDSIDMREQMGISLRKLVPLIAIPFERHA